MKETIYLIQPGEFIGTNIYKIGCSHNNKLDRFKQYKNSSRYICILECIDSSSFNLFVLSTVKFLSHILLCDKNII